LDHLKKSIIKKGLCQNLSVSGRVEERKRREGLFKLLMLIRRDEKAQSSEVRVGMKVRCILTYPTQEQIRQLGDFYEHQTFGLTQGKEYLVLGLHFNINTPGFGTGVAIQVLNDNGHIVFPPLSLFQIIDGRASRYWVACLSENGSVELQPPSFNREHYHERLSEYVQEIVEDFERAYAMIESEYGK